MFTNFQQSQTPLLRYVNIFRVRKFRSAYYKIVTFFEKTVIWIRLLIDHVSLKKISFYVLMNLGEAFIVPSQYSFLRLQFHVIKN